MGLSESQKQQLKLRIAQLQEDWRASQQEAREASSTVKLDQSRQGRLSRMDALQGQAMAASGRRRAEHYLNALERAAQRLQDDPEFGLCQDCGEPIAWARLRLDPTHRQCVECAAARE